MRTRPSWPSSGTGAQRALPTPSFLMSRARSSYPRTASAPRPGGPGLEIGSCVQRRRELWVGRVWGPLSLSPFLKGLGLFHSSAYSPTSTLVVGTSTRTSQYWGSLASIGLWKGSLLLNHSWPPSDFASDFAPVGCSLSSRRHRKPLPLPELMFLVPEALSSSLFLRTASSFSTSLTPVSSSSLFQFG